MGPAPVLNMLEDWPSNMPWKVSIRQEGTGNRQGSMGRRGMEGYCWY